MVLRYISFEFTIKNLNERVHM